ncbi:beta-D-glucoside glucohydrolase [Klebsiella pneumoniae]|nr:beta-D-glucoside glucohydrolase [Klebsiella pneumoniae]
MSPQRLFNDYMPPYKAGLDAGSGAVMVALNSLNGTPATSDSWLLKDVLRDQWGFKGITVSDHGAIKELIKHGVASDPEDAVRVAAEVRHQHEHERRVLQQVPAGAGEVRQGDHGRAG